MRMMLSFFRRTPGLICAAIALLALSVFTAPAEAMFVPAAPHHEAAKTESVSPQRTADLAKIQKALESKVIQQKLMDYGLSPEEAMARVNNLSDSQVSMLASHADAIQAGGMRDSTLILVLLLILLIVLIV
jgi:hypothetical protein